MKRLGLAGAAIALAALAGCPSSYVYDTLPEPNAEHWLRFAQITDVHILDEESPGRAVRMESYLPASWRPHEAYTAQVLDATIQAINRRHYAGAGAGRPVDFVLATGDLADNGQFNELRWFIACMDGRNIVPDSGALDGPLRAIAPEDNPNLPFRARGLAPGIRWYAAFGNHDNLAQGNFTVDRSADDPVQWTSPQITTAVGLLGLDLLTPPQDALIPTLDQSPAVLLASGEPIDPDTLQLNLDAVEAGPIPPDDDRHFISRRIFVHEMLNSTSLPVGHGFDRSNEALATVRYTARPRLDVPVRLVVLDTAGPDALPGEVDAAGAVTLEQFESFFKPAVKAAQDAGEFVIVVTHHPSDDFGKNVPFVTVTGEQFRSFLSSQPNIIAHFCGHMHYHETTLVGGRYPYYEIQTASLIDYPQEGRMVDLYYDRGQKTFYLRSQTFRHTESPTRLSAESYRRASADMLVDPMDYDYLEHVGNPPPPFETYHAKSTELKAAQAGAHEHDNNYVVAVSRPDFPQ